MKVLNWLKKRAIPYNKNTIVTVNGLRIHINVWSKTEFNSRKDGILCEVHRACSTDAYYNKAWHEIYKVVNCF